MQVITDMEAMLVVRALEAYKQRLVDDAGELADPHEHMVEKFEAESVQAKLQRGLEHYYR